MSAGAPARGRARTTTVAALAALVAAALASACGGSPAAVGISEARQPERKRDTSRDPLRTHALTSVPEHTLGPFIARREGTRARPDAASSLAAWVTPAEGSGRRIVAAGLSATGEPRGGERTVAQVPLDTTMLVVGAVKGEAPGYLLAWTSLIDRGEALWAAVVGDDGVPRSKAIELARTGDDVVWVEVVPTEKGVVCLWAEETRTGDATLVAASLDGMGKVNGVPARVARGTVGWHAMPLGGGVGVSIVTAPEAKGRGSARGGTLSFQRLDGEGHALGPATPVSMAPTVSGDVEVALEGERVVFAWTDRAGDEPFVAGAAIGPGNAVEPPRKIVDARGGAALLGLAAGPAGTALLFEAPARAKTPDRRVHLGRLAPSLALERPRLAFSAVGRSAPELRATPSGFAVLASLPDCDLGAPACESAPTVATVLRVNAGLELVQREPLGFGGDPTPMGWGLHCQGENCTALTATATSPSRVRTAEIRPRANAPRREEPHGPQLPPDAPRVTDITAVVAGESVVDLASTSVGEGTLLVSLSTRSEPRKPAGGREEDPAARTAGLVLATRIVGPDGKSTPPIVLSNRALAVGGVSVALADKPEDGALIGWVARENGDPEVHVTRVDRRGKRQNDVQLTTTKGDAGDVSVLWAGSGWLVTWVDGRDGNGEVYATKVGLDLTRTAREERITNAPGDASDLVALPKGDVVWLAWADARESPKEGLADVFLTSIKMRDAKRASDEVRVLPTAAHSRSPQLAQGESGDLQLAWIEEAPLGIAAPASAAHGALFVSLDEKGAPRGRPARIPLAGDGVASSVALDARGGGLRAIVARSETEHVALDAILLAPGSPRAFPLVTLDGPPSLDVALVLEGDVLFFNDDGPTPQDRRARRARIAWAPPR